MSSADAPGSGETPVTAEAAVSRVVVADLARTLVEAHGGVNELARSTGLTAPLVRGLLNAEQTLDGPSAARLRAALMPATPVEPGAAPHAG